MAIASGWQGETRILVYGVTGSGKTTIAREIGERLGLPWHEVDQLTWEPNWVVVPLETQVERIQKIIEGDRWVLDTAYSKWRDLPLARAELIVALDFPRWVSLGRLVKRCLARIVDHKPICNGNRESVRTLLSKDSIVRWHFASFTRKRSRIREWEASASIPPVLRLYQPNQVATFLASVSERAVLYPSK